MDKRKVAFRFIILLGIVSLFSDLTYEGARSITGPFLKILGATAVTVGFVSGLGEFIGYALRIITGYIGDKTQKYWTLTIIGYSTNLIAIPALAFVARDGWIYASALILAERFGKAIRNPAKSTITSFAASEIGTGKGFAIQEALDQIGAFLGPVLLFLVLSYKNHTDLYSAYTLCFLVLGIPAILALASLFWAKYMYPEPEKFEKTRTENAEKKISTVYWYYIVAIGLLAAGFADFPLMSYHFVTKKLFTDATVPLLYAAAMAADAASALFFGYLFDKKGMMALIISTIVSSLFAPFAFLFNAPVFAIFSVILWGIGMGAQESILKAAVASIVPKEKRGTAYGIFYTGFGIFWFLGSWLMGFLYMRSMPALVIFSIVIQLLAIPLLYKVIIKLKKENL